MIFGLFLLLLPILCYLVSIPFTHKLQPGMRKLYLVGGGIITFAGSATSVYFAGYAGDQGGIAAFYFQLSVILVYASFSVFVMAANWLFGRRGG
jgi:hypothetical protein